MSVLDLQAMEPTRETAQGHSHERNVPSNLSLLLCDGGASELSVTVCQ